MECALRLRPIRDVAIVVVARAGRLLREVRGIAGIAEPELRPEGRSLRRHVVNQMDQQPLLLDYHADETYDLIVMSESITVTMTDLRAKISSTVCLVQYGGHRVLIKKSGRVVAALVPVSPDKKARKR